MYRDLEKMGVVVPKIVCVYQADSRTRYDIFVPRVNLARDEPQVELYANSNRFCIRRHVSYEKRHRTRQPTAAHAAAPKPEAPRPKGLRIVTLNVNSLQTKRVELADYARQQKMDVLLLQETRCMPGGREVQLPGYAVVHSVGKTGVGGSRGLAVAVRLAYTSTVVCKSEYSLFVRVFTRAGEILVGSVYIPTRTLGPVRAKALQVVRRELQVIRKQLPTTPIVIGGDFNYSIDSFNTLLAGWNLGFSRVPTSGSPVTWHRNTSRQRWTAIDHFACAGFAGKAVGKCYVRRDLDLSDHFPLVLTVPWVDRQFVPPRKSRTRLTFVPERVIECADEVKNHERFRELQKMWANRPWMQGDDLDVEFTAAVEEVAQQLGLLRVESVRTRRPLISSATQRLIWRRRKAAHAMRVILQPSDAQREQLADLQQRVEKAMQGEAKKRWDTFVTRGCRLAADGLSHKYWRWLGRLRKAPSGNATAASPLINEKGELETMPEEILGAWRQYFGHLSSDTTGHSKDDKYWQESYGRIPGLRRPVKRPDLEGINDRVTMEELQGVLGRLVARKSPGPSGIGPEFLRAARWSSEEAEGTVPVNNLATLLLHMVQVMFEYNVIFKGQQLAHVVPIFKAGDSADPENYRGISLMDCVLKLLLKIMANRLTSAIEKNHVLSNTQAGFRPMAECLEQVAALIETGQRRLNKQQQIFAAQDRERQQPPKQSRPGFVKVAIVRERPPSTFLLFLDFRKAFDMVPHALMLDRAAACGIHGKSLALLRTLYGSSQLSVALPYGVSGSVPLNKGVRQGCPLSPMLFNIFVDDLSRTDAFGVPVPQTSAPLTVGSLHFADDAVVISSSIAAMGRNAHKAEDWTVANDMAFNVSKCGIVPTNAMDFPDLKRAQLQLGGEVVPVLRTYKYLGMQVRTGLSLLDMAKARAEVTRKTVFAHSHLLTSLSIPLASKILAYNSFVMNVAGFGGEIIGMNAAQALLIQRVLNMGLRMMLGLSTMNRSCAPAALMLELGVAPVCGRLDGARARGFDKWLRRDHSIVQKVLQTEKGKVSGRTWQSATMTWLSHKNRASLQRQIRAATSKKGSRLTSKQLAKIVARFSNRQFFLKAGKYRSFRAYFDAGFVRTRRYIAQAASHPSIARGVVLLARARVGALWTGRKAANAGFVDQKYKKICIFCSADTPDTVPHMLLSCTRWSAERERHLAPAIAMLNEYPNLTEDQCSTALLGGKVHLDDSSEFQIPSWLLDKSAKNEYLLNGGEAMEFGELDGGDLEELEGLVLEQDEQGDKKTDVGDCDGDSRNKHDGLDLASGYDASSERESSLEPDFDSDFEDDADDNGDGGGDGADDEGGDDGDGADDNGDSNGASAGEGIGDGVDDGSGDGVGDNSGEGVDTNSEESVGDNSGDGGDDNSDVSIGDYNWGVGDAANDWGDNEGDYIWDVYVAASIWDNNVGNNNWGVGDAANDWGDNEGDNGNGIGGVNEADTGDGLGGNNGVDNMDNNEGVRRAATTVTADGDDSGDSGGGNDGDDGDGMLGNVGTVVDDAADESELGDESGNDGDNEDRVSDGDNGDNVTGGGEFAPMLAGGADARVVFVDVARFLMDIHKARLAVLTSQRQ